MPATLTQNDKNRLENVDWEDILDTLAAQKCVLFLGSGAYQSPDENDIEEALCKWLDSSNPNHPEIRLFNPDGFYLFRKNIFKRRVIASIKEFYNQQFNKTESDFAKIAQIPFSMIVTLSFDNILTRVFDQLGFEYQSDFYSKERKISKKFEKPTRNKPLIYNLLGNIEDPDSLILTHSDFYNYLQSEFESKVLKNELIEEIEKAERFIFLGLPYEKWYFQILLRILSIDSDKLKEIERTALKEFEDPRLQEIYTREFKLDFIPTNTESFIDKLFQYAGNKGILKPLPQIDLADANSRILSLNDIRELVGNADVAHAMHYLKVFIDQRKVRSSKISNDLVVLRNRLNLLKLREIRGTIDSRDLSQEWNLIVEGLLELINQAENL